MMKCQNCGQINEIEGNFCRFCGIKLFIPQQQVDNFSEHYVQPRPYMWKTDEYQTIDNSRSKATDIKQVQPIPQQNPRMNPMMNPSMNQSMIYQNPNYLVNQNYHCPRCNTQNFPLVKRQISTAGWITFAVLLVTTGIFFWIGLLIKEDVRVCPMCGVKIG